jgi:hypothetical protein
VVIVDALKTDGAPGRVSRLALDEKDLPDPLPKPPCPYCNTLLDPQPTGWIWVIRYQTQFPPIHPGRSP